MLNLLSLLSLLQLKPGQLRTRVMTIPSIEPGRQAEGHHTYEHKPVTVDGPSDCGCRASAVASI